jgi:tRNA A37 methylthiotransferase MiaB
MNFGSKIYISIIGCPNLNYDAKAVITLAESNGFTQINQPELADYLIMVGCGFVDSTEKKSLEKIIELNKIAKKDAKIIVYGCIATIAEDKLKQLRNLVIVKYGEEHLFNELFNGINKFENVIVNPTTHNDYEDFLSVGGGGGGWLFKRTEEQSKRVMRIS